VTDESTVGDIYPSLHAVMNAVQSVSKRDRNTHSNYNFRGIDAVMNAVGPALREHGVIVVPNVRDIEVSDTRTSQNKPATRVVVKVNYTFLSAKDGSSIVTCSVGEAMDSGDKATPKAMSVAFRTLLLQALCLPTDEPDPDSFTYEQADEPMASKEQMDLLMKSVRDHGLGGPENADRRQAVFADALGRQTNGGDLKASEIEPILKALANLGPTAEQEAMLNESLGAQPVETPAEPPAES
jgi:hypothetical protein